MEYLIKGSNSSSLASCTCYNNSCYQSALCQFDVCGGKCSLCAMKSCGAGGKSVPYNLLLK